MQGRVEDDPNNPSNFINDVHGGVGGWTGNKEDVLINGFQNEGYLLSPGTGGVGGIRKDEEDGSVKENAPGRQWKWSWRSGVGRGRWGRPRGE